MSDKPVASFVLVLIAAIIDFIIGIIILAGGSVVAAMVSRGLGASWIAGIIMMFAVWWIICGALLFLSSMWINSGEPGKVRNGGIIAIIFGILSLNILHNPQHNRRSTCTDMEASKEKHRIRSSGARGG